MTANTSAWRPRRRSTNLHRPSWIVVFAPLASLVTAAAIGTKHATLLVALVAGAAFVTLVLTASPATVITLSVLVFGTYQLSDNHPVQLGPVSVYTTDILLGFLIIRALSHRPRLGGRVRIHPLVALPSLAVALAFAHAAWIGHASGTTLDTLVRMSMALTYLPLYAFAFSRILREVDVDLTRVYRGAVIVVLGLILFMLGSRATGHPFNTAANLYQNAQGAKIVSADGTILRRDYGLPSAFILYPLIALLALAFAAYARSRSRWTTLVAVAGSIATLLTLIRGEIFGLMFGAVALYLVSPKLTRAWGTRRLHSLALVLAAMTAGAVMVSVTSPELAAGLAQRAIPGYDQSNYAKQTADFRVQAFSAGLATANSHPFGIGFKSEDAFVAETHLDPLYVTHSTPAWLLVFTGWPGLIASAAAILAGLVASFVTPAREAWHHPAFVGVICFFLVYSFSTFGLVGQPWVIGTAALLVALRFTRPDEAAT